MTVFHLTDRYVIGGGERYIRLLRQSMPDVHTRVLYAAKWHCLAHVVNRYAPDVIHVTHLRALVQLYLNPFVKPRAHVVFTVHGIHFRQFEFLPQNFRQRIRKLFRWMLEEYLYHRVDALIALTESDAESIRHSHGYRLPIYVVPNGTDGVCVPDAGAQTFKQGYAYISIARFCLQKGQQVLVRAIALAQDAMRRRGERVLMVGAGEDKALIRRMVVELGIEDLVDFAGAISDASSLLPMAKALIAPSLWEGMPFLLLEAASCGTLVIASDCPSHHEMIRDGVTGYLFPVGDVQALAHILEDGVRSDAAMIERFRSETLSMYPLSRMLDGTRHVYDQVMNRETAGMSTFVGRAMNDEC